MSQKRRYRKHWSGYLLNMHRCCNKLVLAKGALGNNRNGWHTVFSDKCTTSMNRKLWRMGAKRDIVGTIERGKRVVALVS